MLTIRCQFAAEIGTTMRATARLPVRTFLRGPFTRAVLAAGSVLLALPALEIGYRLHSHRPVLALEDWRAGRVEDIRYGDQARFDPELGWVARDWLETDRYSTLDHGIRYNGSEAGVRTGGILAVGDVFTGGGLEVDDSETWPARLERLVATPVLNAGVAGYAVDQIVLRAERLLPVVRPRTLVVGLYEETIARLRYAAFGTSKPYYTIDHGELVLHAPARLAERPPVDWQGRLRSVLGYSAILDGVLSQVAPGYWVGGASEQLFRTVDIDPVAVTCALLKRLKARAEADGVRVLLLMQYGRKTVAERTEPRDDARQVIACASDLGLEVVDQLKALHATVATRPEALDELYLPGGGFGQMSAKGNGATAELLAGALRK